MDIRGFTLFLAEASNMREISTALKKYVRSLHLAKYRKAEQCFLAEGHKICTEFLSSGRYEVKYLLASSEWYDENPNLISRVPAELVHMLKRRQQEQLSLLTSPSPVILVLKSQIQEEPPGEWSIYLDKLQDPGNMGAIIRIADWFGVGQVLASEDSVSFYNPKVVQSAMGSHNRVVLVTKSRAALISDKVHLIGMEMSGMPLRQYVPPTEDVALVMGNEGHGISELLKGHLRSSITIPSFGGAESLNVAVACGIACHHLIR